ncbi:MAG: hypothetical protein GY757_37180 [bacterium]|nr:hypothetical protein [bacterium]
MNANDYLDQNICWDRHCDPFFPYITEIKTESGRVNLKLRINDFPAEALYTLFVNDIAIIDLEDFPENWSRPED